MGRPEAKELKATMDAWAAALGKERRTLHRLLVRNGYEPKPHERIGPATIFAALVGDFDAAKAESVRLDVVRKTREEKTAERSLVEWEAVELWLAERFLAPIERALDEVPAEAREWRDKVLLPLLRQKIDNPSK